MCHMLRDVPYLIATYKQAARSLKPYQRVNKPAAVCVPVSLTRHRHPESFKYKKKQPVRLVCTFLCRRASSLDEVTSTDM